MNKQTFSTQTLSTLKIVILALVLGFGLSYAQAVWQGPTATPTGNNVDAPINVGPSYQTKLGSVSINTTTSSPDPYGLDVFGISRFFGKVGIGTSSPAVALDVVGEARSSTSTIASSNAKTLTTKDYVDTSRAFGSYVSGLTITHSAPAATITTTPILTTTDIILMVIRPENLTSSNKLEVFADTFTPPTTLRQMSQSQDSTSANIILPIPKGYYWKVTTTGQNSGFTAITWMTVGS